MLSKQYRAEPAEIAVTRESGSLVSGRFFSLLVYKLNNNQLPHFAFIVSQKISRSAVKRNQIKRKLKQAVKNHLQKIRPGLIVVFLARKNIIDSDSQQIDEDLNSSFNQAGLYR